MRVKRQKMKSQKLNIDYEKEVELPSTRPSNLCKKWRTWFTMRRKMLVLTTKNLPRAHSKASENENPGKKKGKQRTHRMMMLVRHFDIHFSCFDQTLSKKEKAWKKFSFLLLFAKNSLFSSDETPMEKRRKENLLLNAELFATFGIDQVIPRVIHPPRMFLVLHPIVSRSPFFSPTKPWKRWSRKKNRSRMFLKSKRSLYLPVRSCYVRLCI